MLNRFSLFSLLLLCLLLLNFSSADLSLGLDGSVSINPIKQGNSAMLYQTCNNCTFCNITNVMNPSNNNLIPNTAFTQYGTRYEYLLSGGNTTTLGDYSYSYYCGNSDDSETGVIYFKVTPSGRDGNNNIALVLILIVIIYVITFVSFFGKNIPLSILSGMFMSFFGVWIVKNGIVIYRDSLTNYFGYITLAIGAIISLWAVIEWIEDIF